MTNLFIDIDRADKVSLHKQLIIQLKNQILNGDLNKGEKLPSSRKLAEDISVSRIVTLTAYEQLIAEGYLVSKSGSGTFISDNIPESTSKSEKDYLGPDWFTSLPDIKLNYNRHDIEFDFSIGNPAAKLLPKTSWKQAWRHALDISFTNARPNPAGDKFLREEITKYLKRARNITCDPDNIIITSGAAETLRLLSKAVLPFNPLTFVEKPGFNIAWHWLDKGRDAVAINVDQQGIITDELPERTNQPSMLFVTPSHQFPLGYRLSLKRRNEILKWASRNDALILEDDYDSEFHYEAMPLPTLRSQDQNGQVVYFSSFSKSISPNIKIGYLLAPEKICSILKNIIASEHAEPPLLAQTAMAQFIKSGSLDKHIAKSRRHYAQLNKIMREKLSNLPKDINVSGLDSGIHAFLSFPKMPTKLIKSLEEKSFFLPHQINTDKWHGFALGYGHFEEEKLIRALDVLTETLKTLNPKL